MMGPGRAAASPLWEIRHSHILRDLVLDLAPLVEDEEVEFGRELAGTPEWEAARTAVFGPRGDPLGDVPSLPGGHSALLRDLVGHLEAARHANPEVARVLTLSEAPGIPGPPTSAWSVARWAVRDDRQWRQNGAEVEAEASR